MIMSDETSPGDAFGTSPRASEVHLSPSIGGAAETPVVVGGPEEDMTAEGVGIGSEVPTGDVRSIKEQLGNASGVDRFSKMVDVNDTATTETAREFRARVRGHKTWLKPEGEDGVEQGQRAVYLLKGAMQNLDELNKLLVQETQTRPRGASGDSPTGSGEGNKGGLIT